MTELLAILTPIALLDSTSVIPLCIVPLVMLLSGPNPLTRASALPIGVFVTNLACGLVILFGLGQVFDALHAYALRVWQDPNTEELIFQILLGLLLLAFGLRIARARKERAEKPVKGGMTGAQAFVAGAVLMIVGLPGALPYFGAINLILRDELSTHQEIAALVFYNIVFVAPLAAIVALRQLLGERSRGLLDGLKAFFDKWGQRVIVALLVALGLVMVADGIGWFLGTPLIPV